MAVAVAFLEIFEYFAQTSDDGGVSMEAKSKKQSHQFRRQP